MQYTINRGDKGKIEVKVDVPQAGFEEAYEQILTKLGNETSMPGFRPGKIPRDVLIGHVGSNKVLNQAASFLISKHLGEIFEKEKFFPIDSPKISIESLQASAPFAFVASFTQKPDVKVGDWKSIKVKRVAVKEITDEDVNASIKNIFEVWKKSKESKGQGDKEPFGKSQGKTEEIKEDEGKYIYDAHGNKLPLDGSLQSSSLDKLGIAGLKIPNKVEIHHIDDDFAMAVGARDLAHLRELVKRDLETIVADQVEQKLEQEVYDKILEVGTLEIPELLVEDELNRILVRLTSELERQGTDLDKYLSDQKTTIDELKTKWREQAEKNVKVTLIMDEIGKQEKVTITKEELAVAMKGMSEQNLTPDQKADLERYLALSIFQSKTMDLVKKTVSA